MAVNLGFLVPLFPNLLVGCSDGTVIFVQAASVGGWRPVDPQARKHISSQPVQAGVGPAALAYVLHVELRYRTAGTPLGLGHQRESVAAGQAGFERVGRLPLARGPASGLGLLRHERRHEVSRA